MFTYFERERENACMSRGGAERDRDRIPKETPHCQHRAQHRAQPTNLDMVT